MININDTSYSVVSSGIWLNVEISIGILSACLPLLKPLVSRAFPSQIRSRFSKSRTGSQRLQDLEANGKASGGGSKSGGKGGGGGILSGSTRVGKLSLGSKSGNLSSSGNNNNKRSSAGRSVGAGLSSGGGGGGGGGGHVKGLSDGGIYEGKSRKQPHLNWLYGAATSTAGGGTLSTSKR
ncbi:MAG: hypothetical protein Q9169_006575, partial [Polycauliona sp. 2 TL-2023]